jgi:hypothetical protein
MLVRIRFDKGARLQRKRGKNRHLALAAAALLVPSSMMAAVLGFWRLASDVGWASGFAFSGGPLSHWVIWIVLAGLMLGMAWRLNRYGHGDSAGPDES